AQNNQPTAQFYHVAVDNRFPYYVYGAQQDNSSVAVASFDDEGAIGPRDWYDVGGGECGFVIPDPRDPYIVYSDSENVITRFDKHTEQVRVISVWPIDASGHPASDLEHRFNWTSPLIMSPHNPDTLYVGMERVFKSTNDGNSWTAVSGDLTRNDKSRQQASGGPITKDITSVEYYDTIFALAESPLKKGLLWAGTDDGLVQVTANGGGKWKNVTPHDMPAWSTISMIEPSHFTAGAAYVAVDRHRLDDIRPYIYKTADGGKTWTRLGIGIPDGAFVHAVCEDPVKRGLLYAATETGVFVSFDDGGHWQSLQLNLPRSPVHDLVVKGDDVVIATHGRSFWILDDVTSLRQVASASSASIAFLYAPEKAYRLYYPDDVDARPPVGQNPPPGALIDYFLPSSPSGEITIDILDAKGKEVRHLTSKKSQKAEQPPEWPDQVHVTDTLPAQRGMNRFVWNLRYDDPVQIPGAFYAGLAPRGPIALSGKYTIRLSYAGHTQSAVLVIAPDPRVHGPLKGLQRKFALSMQAYHDLDALHRAVNDIRSVKTELAALRKKPGETPALLAENDAVVSHAAAIEGMLMQVNMKGSEANLNFPGMLNEQIYSFAGLLEDSDTAPNAEEVTTYASLHARLAVQLAAWDRMKKGELATFRTHLRQPRNSHP
ncbi:MAG: glycosyl hydrolase, partial [Alphaproteobacteria bacterium]|nr:glycosyl hydrolase [Alphaproteobacteria bacterium]